MRRERARADIHAYWMARRALACKGGREPRSGLMRTWMARAERARHKAEELLTRTLPVRRGRPHQVGAEVVLSVTSHPPRYAALEPTLRRLLSQTVRADRIMLWLSEAERQALPARLVQLERQGLEIAVIDDLGPHKKYFGARRRFPNAIIVTVDDDMAYRPDMLEALLQAHAQDPQAIIAHRARRALSSSDGFEPYNSWPLVSEGSVSGRELMPTGAGGVLYPPGSIPEAALDEPEIRRLCLYQDDFWLFWWTRRSGRTTRMVDRVREPWHWNGTYETGLYARKNLDANDAAIGRLLQALGPPGF